MESAVKPHAITVVEFERMVEPRVYGPAFEAFPDAVFTVDELLG